MRRCHVFLVLIALGLVVLTGLLLQGRAEAISHDRRQLAELRRLGEELSLTDLALWSEARYTRHPSQADLFTPFQDFPAAPEHFPAGSLIGPEALRQTLRPASGER